MYPSSVVSNIKVKRKHPPWCLYTKLKYILKKKKILIAFSYASYLLSVHDVITCHQRGYGYIHICTQYLIKGTWQTLKDGEDLNWTTALIFHVRTLACCHVSSHSVHQYETLKTKQKKTYQQINKTIPNIFPAMFQTNTRTGPHLLCATCWSHTHTMRKLQLSATRFCS